MRPLLDSSRPGAAQAGGTRHPDHHLQVAQSAWALLAVGFERIGRAFVLDVALLQSPASWRAGRHLASIDVGLRLGEAACTGFLAPQMGRDFQQRSLHRHVALLTLPRTRPRCALMSRSPCPTSQQAVTKRRSGGGIAPRSCSVRQQHQHVDVRMREQLAAAVAAHRHQCGAGGHVAQSAHSAAQRAVDMAGKRTSSGCETAGGRRRARQRKCASNAALPSRNSGAQRRDAGAPDVPCPARVHGCFQDVASAGARLASAARWRCRSLQRARRPAAAGCRR